MFGVESFADRSAEVSVRGAATVQYSEIHPSPGLMPFKGREASSQGFFECSELEFGATFGRHSSPLGG